MNKKRFTNEEIIEALAVNKGFYAQTANSLKCSYYTIKNYVRNSEEIKKIVTELREAQLDIVEGFLMEAIEGGDITATIFFLKTKGKSRGYSEKFQIENIPGPGEQLNVRVSITK